MVFLLENKKKIILTFFMHVYVYVKRCSISDVG